jgi:chromosomal replication initiator protein
MKGDWNAIRSLLEQGLNPGIFQVWIKPLKAEIQGDTLKVNAPNEFVASWVRDRLLDSITEAAERACGPLKEVVVSAAEAPAVDAAIPEKTIVEQPEVKIAMAQPDIVQRPVGRHGDWRFSFDDFVVGPSNELAFAASRGVCSRTLGSDQLFICSSPGLGKTHLLQAIGAKMAHETGKRVLRVRYLTAEEFATHMVVALKSREMDSFKRRFRDDVDILLLEDIHFLQGKAKIQDELMATLDALHKRGCIVVVTSSFLPKELSGVDEQLGSRLCQGFLATIEAPDFETRRRIVEHKATLKYHMAMPDNVSSLLAEHITTDIRQLESCLQNLVLKARLLNKHMTTDLAWQVLQNYDVRSANPGLDRIVDSVCKAFELDQDALSSKSRKRQVVIARNTAFFLARKHTDLSLKEIGQRFNRRHSTVIKGITNLERELSSKTPLGRQIEKTMDLMKM